MNNVEKIFLTSKNVEQFAAGYFDYLSNLLKKISAKQIVAFIEELETARKERNAIFIAGNGGSATTATHMANDIGLNVIRKNEALDPFRVLALTDSISLMTAIANDDGYENIFVNQLRIHYKTGDKLIVISASGNSPNLIKAAEWVKANNGKVIGLLGFDGGSLKNICDTVISVDTPKGEYGPVEDIHLILDHLIAIWLQLKIKHTGNLGR